MRKIAAILIVILLISGGGVSLPAAEPTDLLGGKGGFEAGSGWSTGSPANCTYNTDKTFVRNGDQSLKIVAADTTAPNMYRTVTGLVPGATYTLEGYINGYLTESGRGAGFKTEAENNEASGSPDKVFEGKETTYNSSTNGQWVLLTHSFVFPLKATKVKLYCRLYSPGTMYFDDVKLYMTAPPEPFAFTTSDVFHYTDDISGKLSVELNNYYSMSEVSNKEIRVSISNDLTGQVVDSRVLDFTTRKMEYIYDPSALDIRSSDNAGIQYTLNAEIFDRSGNTVIKSFTQSLYRYERPAMLGADGFVRFDGNKNGDFTDEEVFNPVIAYHVSNKADYAYMNAIGVNVVQVPYWYTSPGEDASREALLAELDKYGLKALFCLYREMHMPNFIGIDRNGKYRDNYTNTLYVVNKLKNDPRVFAYALFDEPLGAGVTDKKLADLEESYKIIRDVDSTHPIYIVDYTSANFAYDLKYCDIFACDPYVYGLTGVGGYTNTMAAIADGRKPVYTIVGTFKTGTGAFPLPERVRHMTYQALAYGAKGFGYYSFEDSIPAAQSETGQQIPLYRTTLWDPMCEYAETDMEWAFKVLAHNDTPLTITDDIAEKSWTENGETYYFLMSMSSSPATRTYKTTGSNLQIVYGTDTPNVVFTEEVTSVNNTIDVTVPSGEIMLFRVKEAGGKVNLIANGDFEGLNGSLYTDSSETAIAYWNKPAGCLVTEADGNHYFQNKTGAATSINFYKKGETSNASVYKLSFRYKHPQGTKMWIRFNTGSSLYDYSINTLKEAGIDEWRTHIVYLRMPGWTSSSSNNPVRIGGYTGSYLAGEWCIDDISLTCVDDGFVFSKVPTGNQTEWTLAENNGSGGKLTSNKMYYKTEVYKKLDSLSDAGTDNEGNRVIYGSFHSSLPEGSGFTMIAAVYEKDGDNKKLISLYQNPAVASQYVTTIPVPDIIIPAKNDNIKYEVKFMLWSSLKEPDPIFASTAISD